MYQKLDRCHLSACLKELLKYTPEEHPDHEHVKAACQAMRDVAVLINKRKARVEQLEGLARWRDTILDWSVSW